MIEFSNYRELSLNREEQPKLRGKGPVDAPKKRLTEPHDAAQHKVLVKLLGDEEAKDEKPLQGKSLSDNDPRFEAGQSTDQGC